MVFIPEVRAANPELDEYDYCQSSAPPRNLSGYVSSPTKIVFDKIAFFAIFPLCLFIFLIIAVAVLLLDGFPVIFAQERVGKDGRVFKCLKFRTMVVDADKRLKEVLAADPAIRKEWDETRKLRNDPRISRCGGFLRKSSLDELPQIFNVLFGDMSLVGPRPVVVDELDLYGKYKRHYKSVRPGVTGLWQVSGRSNTTYRKRIALDVTYTKQANLFLDLWILAKTTWIVLVSRGAV